MKRLFIITAFLIFLLAGCAAEMQGVCRHEALYCAAVFIEQHPVRVAMGPPGHAQAQALIDGKWRWLHRSGRDCYAGVQDNFTPERIESLDQYIATMRASYPWKEGGAGK